MRFYISRRVCATDLDGLVRDVFASIIETIQENDVRDPEQLMKLGFGTVLRSAQVADPIQQSAATIDAPTDRNSCLLPRSPNLEGHPLAQQETSVALKILKDLPHKEREVLTRFYLQQQSVRSRYAEN